jgi:hypothetical protein
MIKNDNVWLGMVIGLILPGMAFLIVEILKKQFIFLQRIDLLYIGCVALNLFIVRYLVNNGKENTSRGVIGATFICAFIFFFYKIRQ